MFFAAFSLFHGDLIAPQENQSELESFVQEFQEEKYSFVETAEFRLFVRPNDNWKEDKDLQILLRRYAKEGTTVVDFGAKNGARSLGILPFIGRQGKIIAFESDPFRFRELFWNFILNNVQNGQIYCSVLDEKDKTLDNLNLSDVSLIYVDANGREDLFLLGAEKTIKNNRPAMILDMLGGIPIEYTDRFIKQEYEERVDQLQQLGYSVQNIRQNLYLALPK